MDELMQLSPNISDLGCVQWLQFGEDKTCSRGVSIDEGILEYFLAFLYNLVSYKQYRQLLIMLQLINLIPICRHTTTSQILWYLSLNRTSKDYYQLWITEDSDKEWECWNKHTSFASFLGIPSRSPTILSTTSGWNFHRNDLS